MLKRSLSAAAAILVAACADSSTQPSAEVFATATALGYGTNTTVVCHRRGDTGEMGLRNINESALGAHLGHGDFQAGPAKLLADGYILFEGERVRGPFPHEYWIEVTCDGFEGTGQFPAGSQNPTTTEVIRGTYDGSTMTFMSEYDNDFYWYSYGPGPANGTGPGTDYFGNGIEIDVSLRFN